MKPPANFKCRHCHEEHAADRRNRGRQRYCHKPECRRASKEFSQRQWRNRPENRNYFRGGDQCDRVRQWRQAHPGYWRHKRPRTGDALQDTSMPQVAGNPAVETAGPPVCNHSAAALQEVCQPHPALIVGLIAFITGLALQDDIAARALFLLNRGRDILRMVPGGPSLQNNENHIDSVLQAAPARASPGCQA
jgi:hypothetical protein